MKRLSVALSIAVARERHSSTCMPQEAVTRNAAAGHGGCARVAPALRGTRRTDADRPLESATVARVVKLVDTADLKSAAPKGACGFDSRSGHQWLIAFTNAFYKRDAASTKSRIRSGAAR